MTTGHLIRHKQMFGIASQSRRTVKLSAESLAHAVRPAGSHDIENDAVEGEDSCPWRILVEAMTVDLRRSNLSKRRFPADASRSVNSGNG
jgi:hypothetical protein